MELACSRPAERVSLAGSTHAYRCDGGYRFVARFEPERVWLFVDDRTLSLPQIPSTSGVHFTDGKFTFRERNGQASTEAPGESHAGCVNQPAAVPWEEARLRGVDFRAAGENPAWTLEIDDGSGIVFDDGKTRSKFPADGAAGNVIEQSSEGLYDQNRADIGRVHRPDERRALRRHRPRHCRYERIPWLRTALRAVRERGVRRTRKRSRRREGNER